MAGFTCPYCNMIMSVNNSTQSMQHPAFGNSNGITRSGSGCLSVRESTVAITFYHCPNCGEYCINAVGMGQAVKDVHMYFLFLLYLRGMHHV